ncbi:NFAT activation molecule 1 isoform X1 [Oxyura jamaicensis]|uniref:NFAT activation molecule 1 isoform X1 n=1 Tax=Oxyura jamaicensis TaxID=8884 RepID=UPI0015A665A0|nr:NFAT activation molecule 1 isoform X1 [Oxyura jamaicensis]XP_035165323.1 NFAT activation molecule 1 isoform X1 [Oxyura jamaicensis]XP_035165331.1 NFAT activation molecule 1 isoform X1 [Oxyura jamaicensis]
MASNLKVIFLFLWSLLCEGGDVNVQQNPLIQVALLKEEVSIPCEVTFPYTLKYTKFSIFYYWINLLGQNTPISNREENVQIPPGEENKTTAKSYNHKTMPLESSSSTGTYYCEVRWSDIQKMGNGVFVLVREKGYIETSYGWDILITFTTLLVALSITATALLVWKRKVLCPKRNQLNIPRQKIETRPPSASPPPPSPVYDCLNSQQVEVYSVLENNTKNPEPRRNPPGKTSKKQESLEESSDTVYENI